MLRTVIVALVALFAGCGGSEAQTNPYAAAVAGRWTAVVSVGVLGISCSGPMDLAASGETATGTLSLGPVGGPVAYDVAPWPCDGTAGKVALDFAHTATPGAAAFSVDFGRGVASGTVLVTSAQKIAGNWPGGTFGIVTATR